MSSSFRLRADYALPVLAALVTTLLIACETSPRAPTPKEPAVPSAPPELGTWGVDLTTQNAAIAPGDDFFRFTNGAWLDTFVIPDDRTSFGSFTLLHERSEQRIQDIVETLSAEAPAQGTIGQKIGDYYASYLDTETINARGIESIRPELNSIAAIDTRPQLVEALGRSSIEVTDSPIQVGISIDRKDPDKYLLTVFHAGLGLPERDYYLEDTERFGDGMGHGWIGAGETETPTRAANSPCRRDILAAGAPA